MILMLFFSGTWHTLMPESSMPIHQSFIKGMPNVTYIPMESAKFHFLVGLYSVK